MVGLPHSVYGGLDETEITALVQGDIASLITGFNFGTTNEVVASVTDTVITLAFLTANDLTVGDKFSLDDGTNALIGVVDSYTPEVTGPPSVGAYFTYTKLSGVNGSTLASPATLKNSLVFSNAQRGHQVAVPTLLLSFESAIELDVSNWASNLNQQLSALNSNGDLNGTRKLAIQDRITKVNNALSVISAWQAVPIINASGRYTDAILPQLSTDITNRQSEILANITTISNGLGSPSQGADGAITGSGFYVDMFNSTSLRMSKGGGSLSAYFQADLPIVFFGEKIVNANKQLLDYTDTFAISLIVGDTTIGQTIFTLVDATQFSVNDVVKIMDNNSVVYSANVVSINANDVEVSSGVATALLESNLARFVRQK